MKLPRRNRVPSLDVVFTREDIIAMFTFVGKQDPSVFGIDNHVHARLTLLCHQEHRVAQFSTEHPDGVIKFIVSSDE